MTLLSQIYGEFVKKFTLWRRRPIWAVIGLFAPLGISTFIIASFATMAELPVWQIGLVDEDNTVQSQALKEAILSREGTIPYYEAVTESREEAKSLFDKGKLYMVAIIPEGFGDKLSAGQPVAINALISNAHADQTKNLRLGLDARLYLFYEQYMLPASDKPGVVYSYSLTYPTEIPRAGYMATGALVLTIMLTAMMYAALFAALEYQEKTAMEVETPPRGSFAGMIGTVLAAMVESFIILAIIFIINWLLWHLKVPPVSAWPQVLLAVLLLAMIFAVIGYGLGQKARDVRLVLGPTMIIVLTLWLMSGGVNPIEAMAGAEFLSLLPTTATLRVLAREMVGLETISAGMNMLIVGVWSAAIVFIALVLKTGIKHRV
jgi:ABC-type multidrug transport system permease subunit